MAHRIGEKLLYKETQKNRVFVREATKEAWNVKITYAWRWACQRLAIMITLNCPAVSGWAQKHTADWDTPGSLLTLQWEVPAEVL